MRGWFGRRRPFLSVIVMVYRMRRQALNTLRSLATPYQRDIRREEYEVIVVENPSEEMLEGEDVTAFGHGFRYLRMAANDPSPAGAVNHAVNAARGEVVGLMVDGARLLTPGVLALARDLLRINRQAVVSVPGYHLGHELQQCAVESGYDEETEKQLLDSISWPRDGYRLFDVSCLSGSCQTGYLLPISESNCVFLSRDRFSSMGGLDTRFRSPGGGLVNLDFYRKICEQEDSRTFILPGEGTFHQFHGGVTTSRGDENREELLRKMFEEYESIAGRSFAPPRHEIELYGSVPPSALRFLQHSVERALNKGAGT